MFRRHALNRLVIALLLASLPMMGLASVVRESQPACAMHMHKAPAATSGGLSAHCKAMMDHAAPSDCKRGAHCTMCDDLSVSLAVSDAAPTIHALASHVTLEPTNVLLSSTVADLWRPPRHC